jgi:hypothetical protein
LFKVFVLPSTCEAGGRKAPFLWTLSNEELISIYPLSPFSFSNFSIPSCLR